MQQPNYESPELFDVLKSFYHLAKLFCCLCGKRKAHHDEQMDEIVTSKGETFVSLQAQSDAKKPGMRRVTSYPEMNENNGGSIVSSFYYSQYGSFLSRTGDDDMPTMSPAKALFSRQHDFEEVHADEKQADDDDDEEVIDASHYRNPFSFKSTMDDDSEDGAVIIKTPSTVDTPSTKPFIISAHTTSPDNESMQVQWRHVVSRKLLFFAEILKSYIFSSEIGYGLLYLLVKFPIALLTIACSLFLVIAPVLMIVLLPVANAYCALNMCTLPSMFTSISYNVLFIGVSVFLLPFGMILLEVLCSRFCKDAILLLVDETQTANELMQEYFRGTVLM